MKKLFALLSLALACIACSDDDSTQAPKIVLSSDNPAVTIGADGKSATVALTSLEGGSIATLKIQKRTEVGVKSNAEWCSAAIAGNEITILANSMAETDRSATVSITEISGAGSSLGEITVNQSAIPILSLSESIINASSEGESRTVDITTNQAEWNATSSASWVKTVTTDKQLTLTIEPNTGTESRTASISVIAGKDNNSLTQTISITQASVSTMIFEYTVSDASTVILPFDGAVNGTISWGDGSEDESVDMVVNPMGSTISHTYEKAGVYNVSITGTVAGLYSVLGQTDISRGYITAVKQWGNVGLTSMASAFYGCPNLKSIPENTRNAFQEVTTFKEAFKNTALAAIPASLFKGCAKVTNVAFCFTGCEFTEIPAGLLDELVNVTECNSLFSSCGKLTTIPAKLFDKVTNTTNLSNVFSTATALQTIPAGLFKNLSKVTKCEYVFYGCTSLTAVPDELFAGCSSATSTVSTFFGCTALTTVGNDVFKGCTAMTSYKWLFAGCKELQTVPVNIFDDSKKVTDFSGTFRDNGKLVNESPYTMVEGKKVHIYERSLNTAVFSKPTAYGTCFRACTSLPDWATISGSYAAWTK